MSNTQSDEKPDEEAVFPFIINSLNDRGQTRAHANQNSQLKNQNTNHITLFERYM